MCARRGRCDIVAHLERQTLDARSESSADLKIRQISTFYEPRQISTLSLAKDRNLS